MALTTNFKDDILASSNTMRKYQMINNSDGSVSFRDVTVYSQNGSNFGAKEVNEEREAINKINNDRLATLAQVDLVTQTGYFVDAMAIAELHKSMDGVLVGGKTDTEQKVGSYIDPSTGNKTDLYCMHLVNQPYVGTITLPVSGVTIRRAIGYMVQTNGSNKTYLLPYLTTGSWNFTRIEYFKGNQISYINTGEDWTGYKLHIDVYYTKN